MHGSRLRSFQYVPSCLVFLGVLESTKTSPPCLSASLVYRYTLPWFRQTVPYQCDTASVAQEGTRLPALMYTGGDLFENDLHGTRRYPKESTVITTEDGTFQIPCTTLINGTSVSLLQNAIRCPNILIPRDDGQLENFCLFPCPSLVFSESEYNSMQSAMIVVGLFALVGNLYMVVVYILSPKQSKTNDFALLNVVAVMGLLWCIVEILPPLILGTEVACACETELCYHDSPACTFSELAIFVHQSLFIFLTSYIVDVYVLIVKEFRPHQRQKLYPIYAAIGILYPLLNLALTIHLSSYEEEDPNYHLNALRSSFTCHPQLSTMSDEILLLYLSTLICCTAIFYMACHMSLRIFDQTTKTAGSKVEALKRMKRLVFMGLLILVLFIIYICVTAYYADIMTEFGIEFKAWKTCTEIVNLQVSTGRVQSVNLFCITLPPPLVPIVWRLC
jgi:hypothetical protein